MSMAFVKKFKRQIKELSNIPYFFAKNKSGTIFAYMQQRTSLGCFT
jgi:hypothetical protein